MPNTVLQSCEQGVLRLVLNRPERANAFTTEMVMGLRSALEAASQDSQVRCVVLAGSGKYFSSGHDLVEMRSAGQISYREHLQETYNPLVLQLRQLKKPVLAELKGAVAGAALGVALACDLRIAATGTQFRVGFSGIGLVPDSAVSLLLPAMIGMGRSSEMAFTNVPISAEQALEWGLVNQVVPLDGLEERTSEWGKRLVQGPTDAIGLTKRAFNRAVLPNLTSVLAYEARLQEKAGKGPEHREGVQAFLEKRKPQFKP